MPPEEETHPICKAIEMKMIMAGEKYNYLNEI